MINATVPQIVAAERLIKGVVIKFDNGRCGFFSSVLLYSKMAECEELDEAEVAW